MSIILLKNKNTHATYNKNEIFFVSNAQFNYIELHQQKNKIFLISESVTSSHILNVFRALSKEKNIVFAIGVGNINIEKLLNVEVQTQKLILHFSNETISFACTDTIDKCSDIILLNLSNSYICFRPNKPISKEKINLICNAQNGEHIKSYAENNLIWSKFDKSVLQMNVFLCEEGFNYFINNIVMPSFIFFEKCLLDKINFSDRYYYEMYKLSPWIGYLVSPICHYANKISNHCFNEVITLSSQTFNINMSEVETLKSCRLLIKLLNSNTIFAHISNNIGSHEVFNQYKKVFTNLYIINILSDMRRKIKQREKNSI